MPRQHTHPLRQALTIFFAGGSARTEERTAVPSPRASIHGALAWFQIAQPHCTTLTFRSHSLTALPLQKIPSNLPIAALFWKKSDEDLKKSVALLGKKNEHRAEYLYTLAECQAQQRLWREAAATLADAAKVPVSRTSSMHTDECHCCDVEALKESVAKELQVRATSH